MSDPRRRADGNEPLRWHLGAWAVLICCSVTIVIRTASMEQPAERDPTAIAAVATSAASAPSRQVAAPRRSPVCGDGICEPPETMSSCLADCPGVTTQPQCGEEPHSDPGGFAVVWGAGHKKESAAECCAACAAHAANPKNAKRPCNSWVFCHSKPQCWSPDTGNWHGFGEWCGAATPHRQSTHHAQALTTKRWRAHCAPYPPSDCPAPPATMLLTSDSVLSTPFLAAG